MISQQIHRASVKLRTRAVRGLMRSDVLSRAHQRRRLLPVDAILSRGELHVLGGLGVRRRLSAAHFPFWGPHAYAILTGEHELMVQEALRRSVAPGMTVFDVGADIGFFSILSAGLAGPTGRVEAFEPVEASAQAVRVNAVLNGLQNVSVHRVAVSDHEGRETLLVREEDSWSHLVDRAPNADARERVSVRLVSLDEEIAKGALPPPDVVKIDVEGSEGAVLRGLERTLSSRRVVVICELHETNAEVLELFEGVGYSIENLDGTEPVRDAGHIHIIARPRTVSP
jgi:FkbM family methyltransferase